MCNQLQVCTSSKRHYPVPEVSDVVDRVVDNLVESDAFNHRGPARQTTPKKVATLGKSEWTYMTLPSE